MYIVHCIHVLSFTHIIFDMDASLNEPINWPQSRPKRLSNIKVPLEHGRTQRGTKGI